MRESDETSMHFKQFYLGCLAHASYLVGADGEAAIVDPQRDVDQYMAEASSRGLAIRYVIETHLHADFVSGHRELAARTGATIVFGHRAAASFPHLAVHEGDELTLGRVRLRILETPGHTPESISILVFDSPGATEPSKVLTGDTLFIGDVGRPDLAGSRGFTPEDMAAMLYDSLHGKLLPLGDAVEVFPAHGAGSMCGRNISKETSSTIGEQRRFNYALQPMTRHEFVRVMTADLPEAPRYFPRDAEINRAGAPSLRELPPPEEREPAGLLQGQSDGKLVLDVRNPAAFGAGHVAGALAIGLGGQFASWAGTLVSAGTPLVLVTEEREQVDEAVTRLARVGLESVEAFLGGGMYAWHRAGLAAATTPQIDIAELDRRIAGEGDVQVVDVRRPPEYAGGHVPAAVNAPLERLEEIAASLDPSRPAALICASGYRSSIGTSVLERLGFRDVANVVGGTAAWKAAGLPLVT